MGEHHAFIPPERFSEIKKLRKDAAEQVGQPTITPKDEPLYPPAQKIELGDKTDETNETPPSPSAKELKLQKALIRREVAQSAHSLDSQKNPEEQAEIKERLIRRYYKYKITRPDIRGHVEAPHGVKPSDPVRAWCKEHKAVSFEVGTIPIALKVSNNLRFRKPRLTADVNYLPFGETSSLHSEGAVYTREDNLTAHAAERQLMEKVFEQTHCLSLEKKVNQPYLAIFLHGKADVHGHDFEIGCKERGGATSLDPRVAFWVEMKLKEKINQKDLKKPDGTSPSVNVVTFLGRYSGSPALIRLRKGDDVLGFQGFGDNLQCLQLECGAHMRDTYKNELGAILNELLCEFNKEFQTPKDLEKYNNLLETYTQKIEEEKTLFFSPPSLLIADDVPEDTLYLSPSSMETLGVEEGNLFERPGLSLTVKKIQQTHRKLGANLAIHPTHAQFFQKETV